MNPFAKSQPQFPYWLPLAALITLWPAIGAQGQELEPRRWGHLPIRSQFAGTGYVYTRGEILFDPVLRIEDAEVEMHTGAFRYVYSFEALDKTARIDFLQGYQGGKWSGLLNGVPASAVRQGWSDTVLRLSMNLIGAPPLEGEEFRAYRKSVAGGETIAGLGLAVHLPTGNYLDDKLLNLGSNRFTFRPQIGVVHSWENWSMELTGSTWIFTDNDEFFGGNYLEQDPLYTLQGHVVYTFRPGLWIAVGAGYGAGMQSMLNGSEKDDRKRNFACGVSAGIPITRQVGFKVGYIGLRARERVGADLDNFTVGLSILW